MNEMKKQNESGKIEDQKIEQVDGGRQNPFGTSRTVKCPRCGLKYPVGTKHVCAKR